MAGFLAHNAALREGRHRPQFDGFILACGHHNAVRVIGYDCNCRYSRLSPVQRPAHVVEEQSALGIPHLHATTTRRTVGGRSQRTWASGQSPICLDVAIEPRSEETGFIDPDRHQVCLPREEDTQRVGRRIRLTETPQGNGATTIRRDEHVCVHVQGTASHLHGLDASLVPLELDQQREATTSSRHVLVSPNLHLSITAYACPC